MKLILHIGTHKTGSTALQQFLSANPRSLSDRGVHYAVPPRAIKASLLVYLLTINDQRRLHQFFNSHIDLARRKRAHTLRRFGRKFLWHGSRASIVSRATVRRPS